MSRRLDDVRLAALMLDGIELQGPLLMSSRSGVDTEGVKHPLGLWDGSTENATVARQLLTNLVERGLDLEQGVLCVIDGGKALRKAINEVLGRVPVQRCIRHKERNVLDHLPERDRPQVKARLRRAWAEDNHDRALEQLQALAGELERSHPGAAASLREGIAETLTTTRLGVKGRLKDTLQSTNPCESMIETVRRTSRNVKRWQSGEMACAGPPPGCSKPSGSSARSSATETSPSSPSQSRKSSNLSRPPRPRFPSPEIINPGGRHQVPRRPGHPP